MGIVAPRGCRMFIKAFFQLWLLAAGVSGFSCPAALKNWQRRAPALQLSDRPTTDTAESTAESDSFDYEGAFKARVAEQTAAEREDTVVRRRLDRLTPEEEPVGLRINQPRAGSSSGGGVPPEPFSRRREVIGGVDAGPAPLSRGGPVNDDARAREEALTESFTQTGFTVLTTTIGASLLFFLATGALGGITDGSDRFDSSGIEPITREAQAETQAADEARAARNRAASAIDGPVAPDGDGRWVI